MKKNGFTLLEMLVVILILSILVTLTSKALRSARTTAKKTQAMVEMQAIETAVKSYFNEYGKLPVSSARQGAVDPAASEAFSQEVIEILTAEKIAENPRKMIFIEPQSSSAPGEFLDPWGAAYLILLDTDYNGEIVFDGETIRRKVGIVSIGFDQKNERAEKRVKSWD